MLPLAVLLSIVGLAVGPALVALHRGRAVPAAAVEGLTLGLVPALVLLRLVPHVSKELGPLALALVAFGYVALWLADRRGHREGARVGRAVIVPALALHALTDGAGLAVAAAGAHGAGSAGTMLGLALVLHKVPEGLFLAQTLVPDVGWRRALWRLGAVAGATVLGALVSGFLLRHVPDEAFDAVVAVGLGAMLRLSVHSHSPAPREGAARAAAGAAFLVGLAVAVAMPPRDGVLHSAQPRELSLVQSLVPLFVETAPSMLVGLLAAGLVHAFMPRQLPAWMRGGTPLTQALRGLAFGVPLPVCSCGVLPLARRLLIAGVPAAAVVAFAVGTPELGLDSAALSLRLLGAPLTAARMAASALIAVGVALAVSRAVPKLRVRAAAPRRLAMRPASAAAGEQDAHGEAPRAAGPAPAGARLREAVGEAFGPALEHTAAWYVFGLVAAAAFEAAVSPSLVARVGAPLDVVVSALAAVPVYVCAQGATPLAAVMIHKGFSVGAALAFLIVGPGTNLAVLGVFRRALGGRAAAVFALSSLACAIAAGMVANAVVSPRTVPDIHPLVAHDHFKVEWVCAALLAAMLVRSLLRLGPRAWFGNMASGARDGEAAGHAH